MDVNQFIVLLLSNLSTLEFVEKVDFKTEAFVLKGRARLKKNRYLQIYFNELTGPPLRLSNKKKEFGESILIICEDGTCIHWRIPKGIAALAPKALKRLSSYYHRCGQQYDSDQWSK